MRNKLVKVLADYKWKLVPRKFIEDNFRNIKELLGMLIKAGYVLHGSRKLIKVLEPRMANCDVTSDGCLKAVYGTDDPDVAIFCAIIPKIEKCAYRGTRFAASKKAIDSIGPGYIYVLKKNDFHAKALGNFVCEKKIKPAYILPVKTGDFEKKIICVEDIKVNWEKMELFIRKYLPKNGIHGLKHTRNVVKYAKLIAEKECPGKIDDAVMGAYLHDIGRINDSGGNEHAIQSTIMAKKILREFSEKFDVKRILFAIRYHADGKTIKDPLIGAIWDADRLDIERTGATIHPGLLSTATGKAIFMLRESRKGSTASKV